MVVKNLMIPIYGGRLHIIVSEDLEKDLIELSKKFDSSLFGNSLNYCALTIGRDNHYLVILNIKNTPKKDFESEIVNSITHEVIHLLSIISKKVGLKLDVDNDEQHAYLGGWLSGEIYKTYLNFKLKQK